VAPGRPDGGPMTNAIDVVDLTKAYGDLRAVDGVTLSVGEGEFVGILGPNGAGKTTLLEMIEGLRKPDAGSATVLGLPCWPRNPALLPRIGGKWNATISTRLCIIEAEAAARIAESTTI